MNLSGEAVIATNADTRNGWAIGDPVISLRLHGTATRFELPPIANRWTIGSVGCSIQLADPNGLVSRQHAVITRDGPSLIVEDTRSTNGIRLDGERRPSFSLSPGAEIGIGGHTLIAESQRLIEFRRLLERFIGWDSRAADVDQALRAARDMATQRAALLLVGGGDLPSIAQRLHRYALGDAAPFVVCCSPKDAPPQVLARVGSGTLCMVVDALPPWLVQRLAIAVRSPGSKASVVICAQNVGEAARATWMFGRSTILELPPLSSRRQELTRLIEEYTAEAVHALQVPNSGYREHDLSKLQGVAFGSLDEIAEMTYRLVILRNWGPEQGGARLGISRQALTKWIRRRGIPT